MLRTRDDLPACEGPDIIQQLGCLNFNISFFFKKNFIQNKLHVFFTPSLSYTKIVINLTTGRNAAV